VEQRKEKVSLKRKERRLSTMTTPNHTEIIAKIGVIETNHCQYCEKWANQAHNHEAADVCTGCLYYAKIRELGDQLDINGSKQNMDSLDMTVDEFNAYRSRGLRLIDIAEEKGVNVGKIKTWQRRNGISIRSQKAPIKYDMYRKLRDEGLSLNGVAKRLHRDPRTLKSWLAKMEKEVVNA
jgi:transposase